MITTRSRYSLRALVDIAVNQPAGPVRAADIARRQRISAGYLERILRQLVDAGLVCARRGPGGGYLLALPADEISIDRVLSAAGECLVPVPCVDDKCDSTCDLADECAVRLVWSELRDVAGGYLGRRTVAEVAAASKRAGSEHRNGLRPLRSTAGH